MIKTKVKKERKKVRGIGIYEKCKYRAKINGKQTKEYTSWEHMLTRCTDKKYHQKKPSYVDCTVCDSWIYFQQHAEWYNQNFYKIKGEQMHLDKDILVRDNKIYSPETCVFVPQAINLLLTNSKAKRGELPIGIHKDKNGKFAVQCSGSEIYKRYVGCYDTKEEAFAVYKKRKKEIIIEVIQRYESIIPEKYYKKLYSVLSKYEVRIDD